MHVSQNYNTNSPGIYKKKRLINTKNKRLHPEAAFCKISNSSLL